MEERRVADYFVVAGLPDNPETLGEFTCDGAVLKASHNQPPITDIAVINRSLGEVVPDGYECIEITPSGQAANLNHGALRAYEVFLCFQRGRDKAPLVDIGVLYEGKERVLADSQIVEFTLAGRSANVNQSGQTTFMTYRRASETAPCNELVVSDICVIMTNKGEKAPHSYCMIDRNLNKGTVVGSDIFVCYKKSMNRSDYVAYKAGIMDHYPHKEHKHFPIPKDLALFCLPMGATLESWPPKASKPDPVFSTFVLTVTMDSSVNSESVEKVYGAAVTFYEKYPHHHLTEEQKDLLKLNEHFGRHNVIHTNKCICFLSHWPFFDTFEKFLRYIHHMTLSGPHSVPLERYISHMLDEVPFPTPRKPRILIQLDATERISLAQPEDSPINLSGAKFRQLLMNLKPEQCLQVLLFALTEQKFLLHSLRPDVLTAVAEAITMLIFPFHWQCPYIPLCPLGLSDFLNAPIPFLLGLDSRFFDLYDPPTDVICIDLDTGAIYIPEEKKYLTTKLLPKRAARVLRNSLQSLCEKIHHFEISRKKNEAKSKGQGDASIDYDFKLKKREHLLDAEIQETFLRFTATTLKGYNNYLLPIVKAPGVGAYDTASLFDVDAFLKSRDKTYQKFYTMMMNTQMFSKFIEERSFVSDKDVSLAFFDDCAEKVLEDDSSIRLLELECAQSEHTSFLLPPEPSGLPAGLTFTYNGFPDLKRELYPMREPKPILPALKNPSTTPGSPLVRRTKHEIKSAQKQATRYAQTPILWAKCLLATCYSLWFTHLPSFALTQSHKSRVLQLAYKILTNMQKLSLTQYDEVCYRVMMQLCGMYSQPVLAVDVLCEMKRHGIQPNAITYGYYNRAVMENKWTRSKLLWNKLRNVIIALSVFKRSGQERARRVSSISLDEVDKASTDIDSMSRLSMESATSLDSHLMPPNKTDTLSSDPGYSSVSETSESVSSPDGTTTTVTTTQAKVGMNNNIIINNTKKQMLAREGKGGSTSECGSTSGVWRALDFTESDAFRTRLGSILRSSASGLACGANLSLIEHNPAFNNSAGLLMTSQLNDSVFDEAARSRPRPTDLAAALSPTLDKYDRMSESSSSRMSPESSSSDRVPEYLSPSNIKNELLSGGLNSMKSGFTALSKKCIELREAISATNTSMRGNIPRLSSSLPATGFLDNYFRYPEENIDEDCVDMRGSRRESADVYSQEDTVIGGPNLYSGLPLGVDSTDSVVGTAQQDLFPPLGWDAPGPFAMSISLTTCTKCHNCSSLLFDEDIMAGWRPDDSNLNTKCAFCERMMVPLLTITMCDVRHEPRPDYVEQVASSKSDESADAIEHPLPTEEEDKKRRKTEPLSKEESLLHIKKKGMVLEPLTVPYLSPLVLRKELETVLSSEGDACLNVSDFTDHHPILYWNLLWYFARIHVPSHLPGLSLGASCASRNKSIHPSWADADWRNVHVVCMWDNPKNHEELGQPMYVQWQQQEVPSTLFSALVRDRARIPRDVMQGIIAAMHVDDLTTSLTALVKEVRKRQSQRHYPFYRDLLFLAASNFSAPPLNFTAFDREYRRAYERIERSCMKVLSKSDSPPSIAAVFCRRYFCQLSL
ncbi:DENN domain-containing protein Crag isoform X9 [Oratosquilla oratoria]|uniref:DENN domain-containing protein Crag isoform X9 n=1 Tax=Oratosquilla oratoria TaxID=337810 RepID=UPI003F76F7D3